VAGTRKGILLRLDPAVHDALARWAGEELRSTNAQIEYLLRAALTKAGRMPHQAGAIPRRGRPRREPGKAEQPDENPDARADADADAHSSTEESTPDPNQ
jgi:hypothetical protein